VRAVSENLVTVLFVDNSLVMVLNASSEPLHIVRIGRAISLVLGEKAEIVSQSGVVTSNRHTFPRPTVIRLLRYVHIPWRQAPLTLRNLSMRDRGLCQWCRNRRGETVDHVIPTSRGGANIWENVVLACRSCNNRKGDRLPEEIGWSLPLSLFQPTRLELVKSDPRYLELLTKVS
jgi:5-methylcytosine-specific restriction endonuclease McrA